MFTQRRRIQVVVAVLSIALVSLLAAAPTEYASTLPPIFRAGQVVVNDHGQEYEVLEVDGEWIRTRGSFEVKEFWIHVPSGRAWRAR